MPVVSFQQQKNMFGAVCMSDLWNLFLKFTTEEHVWCCMYV